MIKRILILLAISVSVEAHVTVLPNAYNSQVRVVINSDDYMQYPNRTNLFNQLANYCTENHLVLSIGLIPGSSFTTSTWANVQSLINAGHSANNHSWSHAESHDVEVLSNDVVRAYNAIVTNLTSIPFQRYNGTNHCMAWVEPGWEERNQADRDIYYTNLVAVGQLVGRSDNLVSNVLAQWNTTYGGGIYYEAPVAVRGTNYSEHVAAFNAALSGNKNYVTYNHAWEATSSIAEGMPWNQILKYVGNRPTSISCPIGMGELYSYDLTASNVVVSLTENGTNAVIDVSLSDELRSRYGIGGYPVTYKFQFPESWKAVQEISVKCVQAGTTNSLPRKYPHEYFSGQNVIQIDNLNKCVYISQGFAETGTNFVIIITPVKHGIPRWLK